MTDTPVLEITESPPNVFAPDVHLYNLRLRKGGLRLDFGYMASSADISAQDVLRVAIAQLQRIVDEVPAV